MKDAEIAARCNNAKPGDYMRGQSSRHRIGVIAFWAFTVISIITASAEFILEQVRLLAK